MAGKHVVGELLAIVKSLLGKATRDDMLRWLAGVIEGNMERGKMQMDPAVSKGGPSARWMGGAALLSCQIHAVMLPGMFVLCSQVVL